MYKTRVHIAVRNTIIYNRCKLMEVRFSSWDVSIPALYDTTVSVVNIVKLIARALHTYCEKNIIDIFL